MTRVALLGVPYDASSSYQRGSAGAPVVIREALWSEAANTWTEAGLDLRESGLDDDGDLWFSDREPGSEARARIEQAVHSVLDSGRRPLLLGGDHSITYPVIRGLRTHYPRLGILHLDAHPDLYHEFQGDRYSHACPFARILEEGLADRLVQIGIGRCHDPGIDWNGFPSAHSLDHMFLQKAEQFHLQHQWQFTHFIEEQGALLGHFHAPLALYMRAGKCSFFMPKEFAF